MKAAMKDQIEQIKNKLNIVDYVGTFVTLKKSGRNYKANCPFHNEKSPSFIVSPDRQTWHCFGACQTGGDIISFCMRWENITFYEALKDLAEKAGVQLESTQFDDQDWNRKERLLKITYLSAEYYAYILHNTAFGKDALTYLAGRGVNSKIVKTFKIGYAPDSWDSLQKFLKKKGFTDEEMFNAGMLVHNDSGRYYDRFRGRLMFPISDIRGNTIGFSGRLLGKGDGTAKYVNTPETYLYHKRENLYGINLTKESIRREGFALLVEGEFDVISPYQHGVDNVLAIKGSAVTKEQLAILKRLTNKLYLALDSDNAGQEAIRRGIEAAEEMEFEMHVVRFTNGKDADEAVRNDPVAFKKALKNPVPVYDFLIDLSVKKHGSDNPFAKKNVAEDLAPFVYRIRNPIVQSYYVKRLAALLDVDDESVRTLLKRRRYPAPGQHKYNAAPPKGPGRDEVMQLYLLSYLLQHEKPYQISKHYYELVQPEDLFRPAHQKLYEAFRSYEDAHTDGFDYPQFLASLPSELQAVCDELYLYSSEEQSHDDAQLDKLLLELKRGSLKRRITAKLNQGDDESVTELTSALKEVEKRVNAL